MDNRVKIKASGVDFFYGKNQALKDITMDIYDEQVTAIIGPSGCGKSTFIRLLNRMNELVAGSTVKGEILLDGKNIFDASVDAVDIRKRVGMVFQKPNPFPKSIFDNISYGLKVNGARDRAFIGEKVEWALKKAALWMEVKDRLHESALKLSGGQQQRLCIARCLAVESEGILFDEPCASLDPISTAKIEELITELKKEYTMSLSRIICSRRRGYPIIPRFSCLGSSLNSARRRIYLPSLRIPGPRPTLPGGSVNI